MEEEPEERGAHPASAGWWLIREQGTIHLCFDYLIQRRAVCGVVVLRELPVYRRRRKAEKAQQGTNNGRR